VVGAADGEDVGVLVGAADGEDVGALVGAADGEDVGALVGTPVGTGVGAAVGGSDTYSQAPLFVHASVHSPVEEVVGWYAAIRHQK